MLSSSRAAPTPQRGRASRSVRVCDRRFDKREATERHLETSGLDFNDFLQDVEKEFGISPHDAYVVATTDRSILDFDKFKKLQDGSTLYLLQHEHQALSVATEEHITFTPHYDTLIRGGMYEYYASQGQAPLAYTLAELIDNALSATAKNTGLRTIEIRVLNDKSVGKPAIIVLDNGCGMTSKQLNNWAVYRLSKFTKESSIFASDNQGYVRPDPVPRSLNSDISYFGVGGKQAVFYIGDSARMISKCVGSPDVHELFLSKEEFERKEKNKEDVYSTTILKRTPGDFSHVTNNDERFLNTLISEEVGKASFTAVVITGVRPEHITFMTEQFKMVTRELAHIYHYYIHGVNGNVMNSRSSNSDHLTKIDIQVTLREKPPKCPRAIHLREVEDDMQTLYINAAAHTFEFRASTGPDGGTVEGIVRYHPFLYDKETYPKNPTAAQEAPDNDEDDNESGFTDQARGKRPIFECFWNGRLIPYTTVSEFEWCSPSKPTKVPAECYSRLSGVLFTNDKFQVTTNKLTYTDLELKLKDKSTIYTTVVNGQKSAKRSNIQNEFTQWLQNCHEKFDKQVKFLGYKGTITRTDLPSKKVQHPWASFSSIEWDGKTYKTGQFVKSLRTNPILHGTIGKFLLYGTYDGDVFATGGQVEVIREPRALYNTTKIIPISKIDKTATDEVIKIYIDNDTAKLPNSLKVVWPQDNPWAPNAVCPAGTPLGPICVEILNRKNEAISSLPSAGQGKGPVLSVHLRIVLHGSKGDQVISNLVAQHSASWGFAFKKNETLTQLGKYTLSLNTIMKDNNASVFGGKQLPNFTLKFTIKEGDAQSFVTGAVNPTVCVGVPFNIPLQLKDLYGHLTTPPPTLQPELECSGLDVRYETVDSRGTTFIIRNVTVKGKILNHQQDKSYDLKVTLPGLQKDTQIIKISLLPGNPHSLHVMPVEDPLKVENGNPVAFNIEIHDEAGNITTNPKQIVRCQVEGLPLVAVDCSNTGAGQLMTKPINRKIINGLPQMLSVQFEMPSQKHVASVTRELMVKPSTRVALIKVYHGADNMTLKNNDKIDWVAGGSLENLLYRLFDEADCEVAVSAEIASMIKVNWTADVDQEDLIQGKLPDIQVPTQVHDERFFQVSYHDQSVSLSFTISPRPDEPERLKVTLPQSTVRLGELLPGNINLELVDQYGNVTFTLIPTCVTDMKVEAEGLDKSSVAFKWLETSSSVVMTGARFHSGPLGRKEMCFSYSTYVERVIVEVTAGVPAQLKLISGPEQPLQLFSGHSISEPFLVELCDEWGNPSPDKRVVVQLRATPPKLTVSAAVISQPVNAEGRASFTVKSVNGPKGYYQLNFTCSFNNKPIPGPSVKLTVIPDRNKPVDLSVEYDTNARFLAGGIFPVFLVTVVSEEGSPITTFDPAAVSMFLWSGVSSAGEPPETATELKCSKPLVNEKNDRFHFRDKPIPEHAGQHVIQFSLRVDETKVLFSKQIHINVVANQPVKLGPNSQPNTPVVSNSAAIRSRTLVENMTLMIMDSHGNPAGQDLDGNVVVSIKGPSGVNNQSLPVFEGNINSVRLNLVEGKAHITRLAIMENSPGENGSIYTLVFQPEVAKVPTSLDPFELHFHFDNDAHNQAKISELTKKKNELTLAVATYEDIFSSSEKLLNLLTQQHLDASSKETSFRKELDKRNITTTQPLSSQDVDRLINERNAQVDEIQKMPRRAFSIRDNFASEPDVLGMVGHLAFVQDDTAAWVISWHIRGDMDCVITKTKEAAMRIYDQTQGRQQVMALDSVYVREDHRPLPHIRNGRTLFEPSGNPVYARELLICPNEKKWCDIVFKNILGDTILIDDLISANNYRSAVVQNSSPCPTILTRQGDRVSARGKFGGAMNKAPPMTALPVFGAPFPQIYHTLKEQIELLRHYQSAVTKREKAEKDRDDHLSQVRSPDMNKKHQELAEKKKQLEDIERQLASTPVRPVKRGAEGAGESSGILMKRAKQRPT